MPSSILGKSAIVITKEPGALDSLSQGSANFTAPLIFKTLCYFLHMQFWQSLNFAKYHSLEMTQVGLLTPALT